MVSYVSKAKVINFWKPLCNTFLPITASLFGQFSSSVSSKSNNGRDYSSQNIMELTPVQMAYTSFKSTSDKNFSMAPPIVIMHGLLGSKNNWKSLAKVINQKTGRTVYTVDARNHGESAHSEQFDYYVLAADILYFLKENSISKACLIGHSMGGRAVMTVALNESEVVDKLFVLDVSPVGASENLETIPKFIDAMRKMEIPFDLALHEARKYADQCLAPVVPETGIRLFLLNNLFKQDGKFVWRVNLEAINKNFDPHIASFPPANTGKPFEGETYFIGGSLSNYIRQSDHDEIRKHFPNASFSYVEGAGHWLHADKPNDFLNTIIPLING